MKTINWAAFRWAATRFRIALVGILCCFTLSLHAQNANTARQPEAPQEQIPSTLTEQFMYLKKKSNTWQEYEVVKITMLNNFWANIQDSLAMFHRQLNETQAKVDAQNEEIQGLNETVAAKDKTIQAGEHASTHISVLGMDILKESFVTFFWAAVSVLALLLGLAIYQYKRSNQVTAKTRYDYRALQHELEEFRKTALDRERKLRRELQTERNTVEELRTTTGQKDKTRFY